jgi:hypothetical protein
VFRDWRHNADILPEVQVQLEAVLDARGKFESIVYDTQGIHDAGSDIVLRYRVSDKPDDYVGFQVKSFGDLSKKGYLQEPKAQRDDSFRNISRLQHYFLLVCTDGIAHKNRIREIAAAFRSADRTEVIEPAFAFSSLVLLR